ncbi:GntR family transcriptional regulator [Pseudalkalibacillus caeni]|uniref:GntR family transcriptional regulator n=1 Tax=Exobacillus caeni TaxID=2574798 RepID=A0A5R9F3S2_9BACL|nr:GntR family transcriptional regulator [Pseudalkalibacillus caeni]TLS36248.1 GntR family transcriptional regulator [Pseudalkalibacillus caeni]
MEAYDFIKKAIIQGDYKSGKRLTEESLAKELKLSRTPIREAIKRLESERLITPLKRGVIVRKFTREDIKQIYDLRALLEGYAAAQGAIERNDENLQKMKEANDNFRKILKETNAKDSEQIKEIMNVNNNFHQGVLEASQNEHLRFHISNVTVLPLVFRSFYWYNQQQLNRSLELHETMYSAIYSKDRERAKTAMLEHIYQGRDHVLKHIEENDLFEEEEKK